MGKEQELLHAAKSGNVAQIEKILGVKSRKSGIQSLISRTVNPNHQDELGNAPLHHAALNGHRSSVELLLKYDASANIPDNSGNYPLHLAAWNGHADVARVLLNTGPSRANVNEQNGTEETALHSAAQFGHSLVVAVLLENHADPYVRNSQCESPLDLAAQYGRMETVKQLLNYHPNLLEDANGIKTHTPLHLAARNGHMNVVSYFLSCGMDVNIKCNSGTALHEASLYGKVDVVNLLLQCGIDATVVDSDNKTVMDLLASHPSARSREIRDMIYERSHGTLSPGRFPVGQIKGPVTRAFSAIYPRDLSYSDVPEPRPFYDGMDPRGFRRSGSYDSVPARRSRQESLNQSSYDIVPPPRDANAADLAEHLEQQPRPPQDLTTSTGVDYSLIGPPEELPPGAVPSLSAYDVGKGYTLLGSPAHMAGPLPRCPLSAGSSTYAEVRSEGEPRRAPPSAGAFGVFDDYSKLRIPSAVEDGATIPSAGAPGQNNPGYFVVRGPVDQHSQSVKQNTDTYDFVSPTPRSIPVSHQQQSVYEIPPLSQRGRGNGQEEEEKVPGSNQEDPSQIFGGRSPEVYENTFIHPQRPAQRQHRRSEYDFVRAPSRKTSEPATYDNVPMPGQDVSSHHLVHTEKQGMTRYGSVRAPGYHSPSDPTNHDNPASVGNSSSHGDRACPLDIPAYEFVQFRKQSDMVRSSTPEMQAFASLPGYEPMGPPENEQGPDVYEFLAPFVGSPERPDTRGDYETLAMVGPQRPGSRPEAPAMAQQAPGSNSLPVSRTPLYEVPPTLSSPVYEIAPPRQQPPASSPVYEMAPPPRQVVPVPPPRDAVMQPRDGHGGQWIEKEDIERPPKVPPRRQNPYSDCPLVNKSQTEAPSSPPKPASYEQVRLEGPSLASVDWERVRRISPGSPGGEYCSLSSAATGPGETANRTSSGSSERSSNADIPLTPPFSPPSPKTAEATVFEAFETFSPSHMSAIPEEPKNDLESQEDASPRPIPLPRRRRTQTSKPKVLPRSDSLHDQEFQLIPQEAPLDIGNAASAGFEQRQDPFSFPPVASTSEVERPSESASKSDFVELHKRFSPHSSREDLAVDNGEVENKREEPDGAEIETAVKPSPLVYENVLFKRGDTTQGCEENSRKAKPGESKERPESYRLSALSADSPMDESEEWQKIEAFLSTIGQIDVPQTLENQIAQSVNAETVPEWLKALDLGQYESSMMANGFDDIRYLNGVIEDDDLLEIGIADFTHRRTITEALKSLPRCPRLSDPAIEKPDSVADWLESISLAEYLEVFQHNGFTTLERVRMLWEVELTSVLEVNLLGHRKRMLASVTEEPKESESKQEKVGRIDLENSSAELEERLAELRIYCPDEKPPTVTTAAPTNGLMAAAEAVIAGSVKATEAKPQRSKGSTRWKHNSLVLINGSVNYSILYLGSHAVKEVTGLESTLEACRKMRLSTAKLQKIPSVVLSISVKGIKFIDGRSRIMVSYHDMKNISYITQDPKDKTVLAYIAKDSKTNQHYCHVFRAESNAVSDEVTMTIGQAFQLAFNQFMQARKSSTGH